MLLFPVLSDRQVRRGKKKKEEIVSQWADLRERICETMNRCIEQRALNSYTQKLLEPAFSIFVF